MNNPTEQIKQMAKNLFKAKTGSSYVKILHPKRDWLIGIGIAFCILVGITVWNGYTYLVNRDGGTTDIEITVANPRYQAELVSRALQQFADKAVQFSELSSGATPATATTETNTSTSSSLVATTTPDQSEPVPPVEEEDVSSEAELEVEESTEPAADPVPSTTDQDPDVVPELSE